MTFALTELRWALILAAAGTAIVIEVFALSIGAHLQCGQSRKGPEVVRAADA